MPARLLPLLALAAASAAAPAWACRFSTGGSALNFGRLDPADGAEVRASVSFTVSDCTSRDLGQLQVAADEQVLGAGSVQRRLQRAGSPAIAYALSRSLGDIVGRSRTLVVQAAIPAGAYSRARAGAYQDSITLCLTP